MVGEQYDPEGESQGQLGAGLNSNGPDGADLGTPSLLAARKQLAKGVSHEDTHLKVN